MRVHVSLFPAQLDPFVPNLGRGRYPGWCRRSRRLEVGPPLGQADRLSAASGSFVQGGSNLCHQGRREAFRRIVDNL